MFWNLGVFMDALSEGQSFSSYNNQFVVRAGWVPMVSDIVGKLLHMAMNFRVGQRDKDSLRLRSKPEAFPAPYFIDTGKFPASVRADVRTGDLLSTGPCADRRRVLLAEGELAADGQSVVQRRRGRRLVAHDRRDAVVQHRRQLLHGQSSPRQTVIQGGPGAWETVLKFSYSNLTNSTIQGGIFWRVTPMLNWYLTDNVRLEFAYGYALLTRFELRGATMFFQSRLQLRL